MHPTDSETPGAPKRKRPPILLLLLGIILLCSIPAIIILLFVAGLMLPAFSMARSAGDTVLILGTGAKCAMTNALLDIAVIKQNVAIIGGKPQAEPVAEIACCVLISQVGKIIVFTGAKSKLGLLGQKTTRDCPVVSENSPYWAMPKFWQKHLT